MKFFLVYFKDVLLPFKGEIKIKIIFLIYRIPNIMNVSWPTVSPNPVQALNYLEINSPTEINPASNDDFGKVKFWNSLPFRENAHLSTWFRDEL